MSEYEWGVTTYPVSPELREAIEAAAKRVSRALIFGERISDWRDEQVGPGVERYPFDPANPWPLP